MERRGRIEDLDRSFDIAFWQAQPAKARFDAAWELIVHACKVKGIDVSQSASDAENGGEVRPTKALTASGNIGY